jgi:hypothetical protein
VISLQTPNTKRKCLVARPPQPSSPSTRSGWYVEHGGIAREMETQETKLIYD